MNVRATARVFRNGTLLVTLPAQSKRAAADRALRYLHHVEDCSWYRALQRLGYSIEIDGKPYDPTASAKGSSRRRWPVTAS